MLAAPEAALADVQSAQTAPPPGPPERLLRRRRFRRSRFTTPPRRRRPGNPPRFCSPGCRASGQHEKTTRLKTCDRGRRRPERRAEDDALLGMIAMEMGAPDPIDDGEIAEEAVEHARLAEVGETLPQPSQPRRGPGRPRRCRNRFRRRSKRLHRPPPLLLRPLLLRPPVAECRWARASSRAACCGGRLAPPTIRWRRSGG